MRIWIVRKHPKHPFQDRAWIAAFEIHKAYSTKKEADAEAEARRKRSDYWFSVGYVEVKEKRWQ